MKLCDIFRLMRIVFIIFCFYKKIILLISSMFRNQLNCCKYKSHSSSCTEHRAKHCERQNMRRNHEQRFRETHAPATSETEMPCSANQPGEMKRKQTHHTQTARSKAARKRSEWKYAEHSHRMRVSLCMCVCVSVHCACLVSVWCSLRVFRLQCF